MTTHTTCAACEDTKALARDVERLTRERDEARAQVMRQVLDIWGEIANSLRNGATVPTIGAIDALLRARLEALASGEPGDEQR